MKQLSIAMLVLLLWPLAVVAKDNEGEKIEVANESAYATAVKIIALDTKVGSKFAVEGPDGKAVPAYYDKKQKKLLVMASVPAGGGTFTVRDGQVSKAKDPKWGKPKISKEGKLKLGKTITRMSGEFENDLLEVSVPALPTVHGRVIIKARKGDYKLEFSPLGASVGCVETEEIGNDVNESYPQGQTVHDEVFSIYPSIATDVEVLEPNPFQRTMRVECYVWAKKNGGDTLDLFKEVGFEITLTWGSPVVKIRSWRNQDKTFWNHNGVNLNEIYIDQQPPRIQADDEAETTSRVITGNVLVIPFEKSMLLTDKTGSTVVHQPDFKKLAIYKECVVLAKDRIMTIQSQSWHEGWKPIEIKAGEYEDSVTLACDVGDSDKPLGEWIAELG